MFEKEETEVLESRSSCRAQAGLL
uniref:Uncharacterized protein n=1 Tax=Arundo donax TaxID=35708 RepID=A0A0A9AIF9_ARUDO